MSGLRRRRRLAAACLVATFLIAGCAVPARVADQNALNQGPWAGRLAVRLDATPPQAFSASFELKGTAQAGELTLFTPLGGTAAVLRWAPGAASLRSGTQTLEFESLEALSIHATGTALPVAALFDWLAGRASRAGGWEADLSALGEGRLTAQRLEPAPPAQLRVLLDR